MGSAASQDMVPDRSTSGDLRLTIELLQKELAKAYDEVVTVQQKLQQVNKDHSHLTDKCVRLEQQQTVHLRELDKLRCVAEQSRTRTTPQSDFDPNLVIQSNVSNLGAPQLTTRKLTPVNQRHRTAISDEPCHWNAIVRTPKNPEIMRMLTRAMRENPYTSHLELSQRELVAEVMTEQKFNAGEVVIQEGDEGLDLFVTGDGVLEMLPQSGGDTIAIHSGQVVGEMAMLYNCRRTATLTAKTPVTMFKIDRHAFQLTIMRAVQEKRERLTTFFRSVPLFAAVNSEYLSKLIDAAIEVNYEEGSVIVKQGEEGRTFFLIAKGTVSVLKAKQTIQSMGACEFFGERALIADFIRTASCVAESDVSCVEFDTDTFFTLIAPLEGFEVVEQDFNDAQEGSDSNNDYYDAQRTILSAAKVEDISLDAVLGVGGFGRVQLGSIKSDPDCIFAVKMIAKMHVLQAGQEEHVSSEIQVLAKLRSPFCVQFLGVLQDERFLYIVMEPCLGGELWRHLKVEESFSAPATKFFVACVVEALSYLHNHSIIYRDLKPENLMIDSKGYLKLVDFGFAKKLQHNHKTWTFCGTPDYMAPEIVMNQGHDFAVDFWSVGILIYELLTGRTPFGSTNPMDTYNLIILGINHVKFDSTVDNDASDLVRQLCRESPQQRLGSLQNGIRGIKQHRWFGGFPWLSLKATTLAPPIIPELTNARDTNNFDDYEGEFPEVETTDLVLDFEL